MAMKKLFIFLVFPYMVFPQSLNIEVQELFHKKQYIKAEQLAKQQVKNNPNDINAIELLGDAYGHQKKWDEAIASYKKLVQADDNNANYHYKYGGALGMKALEVNKFKAIGLIGDVKSAFLRAAELDSKHIEVRWALVELYMQLPGIVGGSMKKALNYADELEALSQVDGYLAKGYIYEYDKQPKQAEHFYKKAIDVGGSLTCFEKLSTLYENENQPVKAISTIEESYSRHNSNALQYQIGKVCADYNIQLEKGERCLKSFIKNHTVKDGIPLEWAYYRLAQIYKHRSNKTEALKWIDKALNARSDFEQALKEREIILSL